MGWQSTQRPHDNSIFNQKVERNNAVSFLVSRKIARKREHVGLTSYLITLPTKVEVYMHPKSTKLTAEKCPTIPDNVTKFQYELSPALPNLNTVNIWC